MLVYHYNTELFPDLRSLVAQGRTGTDSDTERDSGFFAKLQKAFAKQVDARLGYRDMSYDRHVSFFLQPIPLDIAKMYDNRHDFWQSGMVLQEYAVDLFSLPEDISFTLTESPEKTKLLYETQDWDKAKGDPSLIAVFKKQISDMEKKNGYIGHRRSELIGAVTKFNKQIRNYVQLAAQIAKEHPEDGGFQKYAACIPHLMIYPGFKPVAYQSVKQITLK